MKAIFFLFALAALTGCTKLTEEPQSFVPPEKYYSTPAQVESAFAAAMDKIYNEWEGYSDGIGAGLFVNDDQYYGGDLVISSSHADLQWKFHYTALLNINTALKAIKGGSLAGTDQEIIDGLVGQGRFLRAYNYFMLVRMFGGVALLTEDSPDPIANDAPRNTVAETYALIESDFQYAIANLPDRWPDAPGKPTKGAAKGLLAKAYLTMATAPLNETSNYAKAAALALEVIQSGIYSLEEDVNDVFQPDHKYGPEYMWSLNANEKDRATDPHSWKPDFLDGWSGGKIEPAFEQTYPVGPRKEAYLFYQYNGIPYTDASWSPDNYPFVKKFANVTDDEYKSGRSTLNVPVIRYADVLLIYAEAKNMANGAPTQDAVDAINEVIDRANGYVSSPSHPLLTTGMSKDAFDNTVIQERSWELCFEMDRWFDLVRKHMVKEKNPLYEENFTVDDYLFPIPAIDLLLDKALTQNPGYPAP